MGKRRGTKVFIINAVFIVLLSTLLAIVYFNAPCRNSPQACRNILVVGFSILGFACFDWFHFRLTSSYRACLSMLVLAAVFGAFMTVVYMFAYAGRAVDDGLGASSLYMRFISTYLLTSLSFGAVPLASIPRITLIRLFAGHENPSRRLYWLGRAQRL